MAQQIVARAQVLYGRYGQYLPALAFLAGLTFDSLALGRIDNWVTLARQAAYLGMSALLILGEYRFHESPPSTAWLAKVWPYQSEANHFLLGSLLSSYTVFYFKSASIWPSLVFFLIILACLVGNEFKVVKSYGRRIRVALLQLCVVSYAIYFVPILWGEIGVWPFVVALVAATIVAGIFFLAVRRASHDDGERSREVPISLVAIVSVFAILYAVKAVPPVPLAIKEMGIYRSVKRLPDGYEVTHRRPAWKIWHNGDQDFLARPGDRVYCFFSVFSPGGFRDQLRVRWYYYDVERGYVPSDAIPVSVSGGRDEGYRGYTYKQNYHPGKWSVRVETSDGREVGRIALNIEEAPVESQEDQPALQTERL